jgi:hypothetical protein
MLKLMADPSVPAAVRLRAAECVFDRAFKGVGESVFGPESNTRIASDNRNYRAREWLVNASGKSADRFR